MTDNNISERHLDVTNAATPVGEQVMAPQRPSSATDDIRAERVDHDTEIARAPVDTKEAAPKKDKSSDGKFAKKDTSTHKSKKK